MLRRAQAESGAIRGTLRAGQLGASGGQHLLRLSDAFKSRHPACDVEVSTTPFTEPLAPLRRGEIDLLTSWLPIEQPDLIVGPVLFTEPRVLAVAPDHSLSQAVEVSIEDLADYRLPRFEQMPPELLEVWTPSRTPSGRAISGIPLRLRANDPTHLAVRIASGELVHPTVPSVAAYLGEFDLVYVPINDMPPLRSALIWRADNDDPRVREFAVVADGE